MYFDKNSKKCIKKKKFLKENTTFLIIMKTENIKNSGQMVRMRQMGNLPRGGGQTGQISRGGKRGKLSERGGNIFANKPIIPTNTPPIPLMRLNLF